MRLISEIKVSSLAEAIPHRTTGRVTSHALSISIFEAGDQAKIK